MHVLQAAGCLRHHSPILAGNCERPACRPTPSPRPAAQRTEGCRAACTRPMTVHTAAYACVHMNTMYIHTFIYIRIYILPTRPACGPGAPRTRRAVLAASTREGSSCFGPTRVRTSACSRAPRSVIASSDADDALQPANPWPVSTATCEPMADVPASSDADALHPAHTWPVSTPAAWHAACRPTQPAATGNLPPHAVGRPRHALRGRVAASTTSGRSLDCIRLQPILHTVAAYVTYGCRPGDTATRRGIFDALAAVAAR